MAAQLTPPGLRGRVEAPFTILLRGTASNLVAAGVTTASLFVVAVAIARSLGSEAFGTFSVTMTAIAIAGLVADLGLDSLITREFAPREDSPARAFSQFLRVKLVTSSALAVAAVAGTLLIPIPHRGVVVAGALYLVSRSASSGLEHYCKATRRRTLLVAASFGAGLLAVGGIVVGLRLGINVQQCIVVLGCVESLRALALWWSVRRRAFCPDAVRIPVGHLVREGIPFAAMGIFGLILARADILLLALLSGPREAGLYSAADRFLFAGNLLAFAVYGSSLPLFAGILDAGLRKKTVKHAILAGFLVSALGSVLLSLFATYLINATFGFPESAGLLRVLALTLPFLIVNTILGTALFALHQEALVARILGIACAVNILLNLAFIPVYGAVASAVICVGTEALLTLVYARIYRTTADFR